MVTPQSDPIRRRVRFTAALFLAAGLAAARPAAAQDTPREVRAKAQVAIAQGAFAEAIGFLEQLVEWFGASEKETTAVQMESVYYYLGICHFFLGQFAESRTVFETYLKKYRTGPHADDAAVYIADSYRFEGQLEQAVKAYRQALKRYALSADLKADVCASVARCFLAADKWDKAMPWLRKLYQIAPDFSRRNWAATLLTTAYLKEMDLERVYRLVPYLLLPDSFAARSVALNMAALEAGDALFADERYRDALWVYRLVYPHDELTLRSQQYLEVLERKAERLKRAPENPRALMRVQESIGELEAELKALAAVENYDVELHFRIGRAYMETRRYREATEVFVYLHDQGDPKKAQEALYLAFLCAAHVQPLDRALKLGHDYMDEYPGGEYYDSLSLMLGQLYAKLEDWPQVVAVLTRALEASPKHESAAECMFLIGYASFMEEKFPDTITWLRRMNATFPGNPREADGTYWIGMALMFERQFDEAAVEFDAILNRFPDTPYLQDSAFRRAVCEFGSSRFREAEKMLELFVSQYPTNKLSGEAYMMLGDIGGVFGELTQGVERYQQVPRYDVNIEFYNYAMFRCGEMLNELNDFAGMVRHFKEYIARNREGSNLPLAMYWVGSALWSMGEQKGALEYFRQGIEKYGVDRKALGIDLILEEWVGRSRGAETGTTVNAWRDLADLLQKSEKEGQQTLGLRLKRIFLYEPEIPDERKRALLKELVQEKNLPLASPGVLELILDEAQKAGNRELAQKTADAVIRDFPETDTALTARRMLADYAIQKKDFATAIKHLNIIREVFATSGEAAEALMMLGDLYLKANQYAEADECYKSVLGVREWRGALWPAALYGRGECARMQRAFEQASAYYERIYLMYAQYRDWTARAYLARAQCLTQIMQYRKAAETLEEMLGNTELVNLPEAAQGRQLLNELKRRIL